MLSGEVYIMKISWGNIIAIIVVVMVLNVWFRVFFPLDDDSSFIWFAMSEFTLFVTLIGVTFVMDSSGESNHGW
jgi:hypothetical protein